MVRETPARRRQEQNCILQWPVARQFFLSLGIYIYAERMHYVVKYSELFVQSISARLVRVPGATVGDRHMVTDFMAGRLRDSSSTQELQGCLQGGMTGMHDIKTPSREAFGDWAGKPREC
jgi:hypothetical protein